MARKEKSIVAPATFKRDAGKRYYLREMPASQAEEWGMRALLALAKSGVDLPENFMSMGLAGMAVVGVRALGGLAFHDAKPLFEEMMACVLFQPDPSHPEVRRPLIDDDTEEVQTRLWLRQEVLALHIDFFTDAGLLKSVQASMGTSPAS